jgi:hypothetical protein
VRKTAETSVAAVEMRNISGFHGHDTAVRYRAQVRLAPLQPAQFM